MEIKPLATAKQHRPQFWLVRVIFWLWRLFIDRTLYERYTLVFDQTLACVNEIAKIVAIDKDSAFIIKHKLREARGHATNYLMPRNLSHEAVASTLGELDGVMICLRDRLDGVENCDRARKRIARLSRRIDSFGLDARDMIEEFRLARELVRGRRAPR